MFLARLLLAQGHRAWTLLDVSERIDIDADLNMVDDHDRHIARRPTNLPDLAIGDVLTAGRPGFWSWVRIDHVDARFVTFHPTDTPTS